MKRSPLIILFITVFIDLLGFGLVMPLLPIYIEHYGGQPWVGGALLACYSVMQFIFAPIWGRASDRYGRRPLILLSLIGSATSFYFFGAARNLGVLFFARVSAGILSAASLPTSQAYIADVTPPEKRAGGMALIGAAFGLGFALGPALSGVLSQHPAFGITPLAMPAYFAAALSLANFLWALFVLPETHTERTEGRASRGVADIFIGIGRALQNPAVQAQLTVFAFTTFAFTAVESSFSWLTILRFKAQIAQMAAHTWQGYAHHPLTAVPLEVRKLIPANADWSVYSLLPFTATPPALQSQLIEKAASGVTSSIFMIVGVTILIVQVAVMRGIAGAFGERRLIIAGTFLLTLTLIGIAIAPSLMLIKILSAFIAIGNGILSPSLTSLITQAAGRNERGTVSGAQQGLGSLARIIAPPINNSLVAIHTGIPFLCSSVLMGIAFCLSLNLSRTKLPSSGTAPLPTGTPQNANEESASSPISTAPD